METNTTKIKTCLTSILLLILLVMSKCNRAAAQCVVTSSNGYSVNLSVNPVEVIPNTTSCTWGYNFNYKLNYNISFSGSNIPSSLYTLQGYVDAPGFFGNFFDLPNNGGNGTVNSSGNSYTFKNNCNTVTVASLNPSIEIVIQGPGISYQVISCPIVSLPVELISFTGKKSAEGIMLNWSTAMEKNNDYFTIEKSSDALNWKVVEQLKGAGNSDQAILYSFEDVQPLNGLNYYRLKQTDLDGRSVYSKVVVADNGQLEIETSVYPNPSAGSPVHLKIITPSQEGIEVEIFNTLGQKLQTYSIEAGNGFIDQQIELPSSGTIFFITVLQNNTVIGKHQVLVR